MLNLLLSIAFAGTVKIAVLDTGFKREHLDKIPLCEPYVSVSDDTHGHGTNVVGLIQKHAGKDGYCFYIYNVLPGTINQTLNALNDAIYNKKVDVINYSGGYYQYNRLEYLLIKQFLNQGGTFIAAAGNDKRNLTSLNCNYFPACVDEKIVVVGNRAPSSNYGPMVDHVVDGNNQEAYGIKLSGSSQATAMFTGTFVRLLVLKNKLVNK